MSDYLVPFDGTSRVSEFSTTPPDGVDTEKKLKKQLREINDDLYDLQRVLYAHNKYSLLLIFQAMDAAGKDSTIRTVMRGVNPAGCQVFSFKQPSAEELDHDFLWRSATRLPERGRIGIFNRSYYEEVLVVKVHPEYLDSQRIPEYDLDSIWQQRYASIRDHERHLAQNGTVILKFWLNVSRSEQKERFLSRLTEPAKNWKFSPSDVKERQYWDKYMDAYEILLNETSRQYAPWFAIPADNKPFMRVQVGRIIRDTLKNLNMSYPSVSQSDLERFEQMQTMLKQETDSN
ncbi:MAG: PPK2 family polyphosphate kinase [Pseudomonadota bacterium]